MSNMPNDCSIAIFLYTIIIEISDLFYLCNVLRKFSCISRVLKGVVSCEGLNLKLISGIFFYNIIKCNDFNFFICYN